MANQNCNLKKENSNVIFINWWKERQEVGRPLPNQREGESLKPSQKQKRHHLVSLQSGQNHQNKTTANNRPLKMRCQLPQLRRRSLSERVEKVQKPQKSKKPKRWRRRRKLNPPLWMSQNLRLRSKRQSPPKNKEREKMTTQHRQTRTKE